jgi:hypothetical protein
MPSILDSFFVSIKLDPDNFLTGRKKVLQESASMKDALLKDSGAVERGAQDAIGAAVSGVQSETKATKAHVEELGRLTKARLKADKDQLDSNKKVKDSYDDVRRGVLATMATLVSANGIKNYVANTITNANTARIASSVSGIPIGDLTAFQSAIKFGGGDPKAAGASMMALSSSLEGMRFGQASPEFISALQMIQASPSDGEIGIYRKFAKWAEGQDPRLVAMMGRRLGLDDQTIATAMKGQKEFDQDFAEAQRIGKITQDQADKLGKWQKAHRRLGSALDSNGREIVAGAAPGAAAGEDFLTSLVEKHPTATKGAMLLTTALTALGSALGAIKMSKGLIQVLGIFGRLGGAVAGGAEAGGAVAGVAEAGGAVVGGVSAAALAVPATIVAAIAAIFAPSGGQTGEDARMRERLAKWRASKGRPAPSTLADRQALAKAYFMDTLGLSNAQASAMVAAMMAENGSLSSSSTNPISAGVSHAYGLGQWLLARQTQFKDWAGHDIHHSTFEEQLRFMVYELTHSRSNALSHIRAAKSQRAALAAMITGYFAPGAGYAGDFSRGVAAMPSVTNIQTLNVHTTATHAPGIARDIHKELNRVSKVAMSSPGMN